ncbi:MAG: ABC transporter permease [Flavisolibacter sp.]|nr:ABC transporter permease [Flavisolibacter sp.]
MSDKQVQWEWEIKNQTTWLGASLKELYSFKDLLFQLVRKDFLASYQQTLLGPFWVLLLPILTVLTYVLVFSRVIGISTQGVPPLLYYLIGITLWSLFSDIFLGVIPSFAQYAHIFNKVYFPRIIVPLSILLLHCLRFSIQLALLILIFLYYYFKGKVNAGPFIIGIPVVIITAGIAFGAGLFISIFTIRYRDLLGLVQFIMRLFMFVCPVFYSLAMVPAKVKWLVNENPLSSQFEAFRYAFVTKGQFSSAQFLYSAIVMVLLVAGGVLLFNKSCDKLMDVV